jgi:two-component system copper resistance phosphate regulon response regulator CusR
VRLEFADRRTAMTGARCHEESQVNDASASRRGRAKTAAYLQKGLSEHGFVVDVAEDGEQGLHLARTGSYDLLVVDVMVPKRDGWSVLPSCGDSGKQTPALFLTARDAIEDRVRGLELGADDYLVKPFAFSELLARVRSVLRRGPDSAAGGAPSGPGDRPRAYRARARPRASISRQGVRAAVAAGSSPQRGALAHVHLEQVWDMNFDSETNVVGRAHPAPARQGGRSVRPEAIHTVRGIGYVLEERAAGGEAVILRSAHRSLHTRQPGRSLERAIDNTVIRAPRRSAAFSAPGLCDAAHVWYALSSFRPVPGRLAVLYFAWCATSTRRTTST